jgi:protein-S-isoprenylcysteine O-methyltransferase Ste14
VRYGLDKWQDKTEPGLRACPFFLLICTMLSEESIRWGNILFRYRSYFPILLIIPAMAFIYFTPPTYNPAGLYPLFALLPGLFGLFIRIMVVGYSAPNTSGRNTKEGQVADSVNSVGMYSLVRHPLYTGNYFLWLSPALLTGSLTFIVFFSLIFWLYYERIMMAEESFMAGKFGDEYVVWARSVPSFFPKIRFWTSPKVSFAWKKVLRKEKNGLWALSGIMLFMLVWVRFSNGISWQSWLWYTDHWFWFSTFTTLLYCILKWMKYSTQWLQDYR